MTKKIIILLAATGLVFFNSACTSQKTEGDTEMVETADAEKIDGEALELSDTQTDPALDAALGEAPAADPAELTETPITEAPPMDVAAAPVVEGTDNIDGTMTTTETTTTTTIEGNAAPVVESSTTITETPIEGTAIDTSSAYVPPAATDEELTETPITDPAVVAATLQEPPKPAKPAAAKPSGGALKKVALTAPYQGKDGAWINTVYVARPKESLADISMKLFGSDRSADLKKVAENSYLRNRAPRGGDKIYYSSPNRPDDSSKTLMYQEDMGMMPETYVAKKGDNLRTVSKELLGYDNAWKEVWTSNSVESKAGLKEGELLRYWAAADTTAAAPAMPAAPAEGSANLIDSSQAPAATAQTAPPTETLPPPPADAAANLPPPPPPMDGMAPPADPMAPPPADPMAAAGSEGLPPPPPETAAADVPPPPPPEEVAEAPRKKINLDEEMAAEEEGGLDSDTMMSMGALGVLVALLAFVIIRRKKQKAAEAQAQANNENEINA